MFVSLVTTICISYTLYHSLAMKEVSLEHIKWWWARLLLWTWSTIQMFAIPEAEKTSKPNLSIEISLILNSWRTSVWALNSVMNSHVVLTETKASKDWHQIELTGHLPNKTTLRAWTRISSPPPAKLHWLPKGRPMKIPMLNPWHYASSQKKLKVWSLKHWDWKP